MRGKQARAGAVVLSGASVLLIVTAGCATKNYVRNQTAPLVQHTNELEDQTAANHRSLENIDQRTTQGIQQVQTAANAAGRKATSAGQTAIQAKQSAQEAMVRAHSLASVVRNLDSYRQVAGVSVHFGFDKSTLTRKDREKLDDFASRLANAKSYILEVTGGTDSTGNRAYNNRLSQRRAEAVARYLTTNYEIPPHKLYLIGIGESVEVASNRTSAGRAENRRVRVQLLSNYQPNAGANQDVSRPLAPAGQGSATAPSQGVTY